MRTLKSEEEKKVLDKLQIYIGDHHKDLLSDYELRLNNQRVYLIKKELLKAISQIGRDKIASCGITLGKVTKTENFRISVTAMYVLSQYALHKVWIKASAEMNYLYGNNALKSHIFKISENIPMNGAVFVYNQRDIPLGFGLVSVNPNSYTKARGGDSVILTQADTGEYIRNEKNLP